MPSARLIILLLLVFCCAPRPAAAQAFSLGAKGGAAFNSITNVGQLTGEESDRSKRDAGLVAGLFGSVDNTHGLDFQAELLFVQKNVFVDSDLGTATAVRLRYIELPLFVKLSRPFTGGNRRLFVLIGPSGSYRLNATVVRGSAEDDISDDVPRFDLAGAVGVGLEMGRVHVEGRFTQGLLNLSVDNDLYARHRSYAILAGVRF